MKIFRSFLNLGKKLKNFKFRKPKCLENLENPQLCTSFYYSQYINIHLCRSELFAEMMYPISLTHKSRGDVEIPSSATFRLV